MLSEVYSNLLLMAATGAIPTLVALCAFVYVRDYKRLEAELCEQKRISETYREKANLLESKIERLEIAMVRRTEQIAGIKDVIRSSVLHVKSYDSSDVQRPN